MSTDRVPYLRAIILDGGFLVLADLSKFVLMQKTVVSVDQTEGDGANCSCSKRDNFVSLVIRKCSNSYIEK